jgi:hypothetical protein
MIVSLGEVVCIGKEANPINGIKNNIVRIINLMQQR